MFPENKDEAAALDALVKVAPVVVKRTNEVVRAGDMVFPVPP
jgi:hypothetical protein